MFKPVQISLVGCGAVSEILHAGALYKLSDEGMIETSALVDPNSERASKIGKMFPLARHFRDVDTMLAEITPDLAIIATPPRFHADLSVRC